MPDLVEQMYCSQQIHIPPTFPFILKQYCKAAIRTQPYDLLRWSAAYFRCMAIGEPPPVKVRLEYPQTEFPSGLSPGYLRVLLNQFAGKQFVGAHDVFRKWKGVSLDENALAEICMLGRFGTEIDTLKFIAITAAYLCEKLSRTMILLCEILTEEPEGGSAMIPCETFINLYTYLARMNCGPVLEGENAKPSANWEYNAGEEAEEEQEKEEAMVQEEEVEEEKEQPENLWQITESEPHLSRCISSDDAVLGASLELSIKNALWEALLTKLPGEEGAHEGEGNVYLKEELWVSVKRNLGPYSHSESDTHTFLQAVLGDIPGVQSKDTAEDEEAEEEEEKGPKRTLSGIMKTAIWDAITEKQPPPSMKGTVWETLCKLVSEDQQEILKNELWNAVIEKIPSLQGSSQDSGGSDQPLKYLHGVDIDPVPSWLGKFIPTYRVEVKGIGPVVSEEQIQAVVEFMKYWAERQEDMAMPRNIRHFLCPPLDPPEDYGLPEQKTEEEEEKTEEEEEKTEEEEQKTEEEEEKTGSIPSEPNRNLPLVNGLTGCYVR